MYGLPDDYYDTYRIRVRAVTTADVQRVAQEQLRVDELQLAVVGDAAVVAAQFAELGVGDLRSHKGCLTRRPTRGQSTILSNTFPCSKPTRSASSPLRVSTC